MKFLVEFHFQPGEKDKALEVFEIRGPNRNPGIKFCGAWVGTQSDVAFALVESADEELVEKAAQFWNEHGSSRIHPVVDIEQF